MPTYLALPSKTIEIFSPAKLSPTGGTVLWSEDFESNVLKFSGGTIVNTTARVRTGTYALAVTSAGAGPWATNVDTKVIAANPDFFKSVIGIEVYAMPQAVTTAAAGLSSIEIKPTIYDGVNSHLFGARMLYGAAATDAKLQYLDSASAWQDVTDGGFTADVSFYNRIKILVNPVTKKYHSIEFGGQIYDLSTIAYNSSASVRNQFTLRLGVDGIDANTKIGWFDDLMVTYNEPV